MDDGDFGRYGVLRLMKRHEPDVVVTSFPIDDEEVTFGRDQSCSVRLYYNSVSAVHAKVIFQERKAFLVVLGTHGVHIDNCPVFPSSSASGSEHATTVPLANNSHIEIHKKRFRFEYPPKAIRAALLATPSPQKVGANGNRRALRMSMIQSAQVFSPAPSPDPRTNLRILQTPIKPLSSPLKNGYRAPAEEGDEEEDEQEIVLVDGDCPRVVQEEKDLVILEDVEIPAQEPPMPTPRSHTQRLNIQKRRVPSGRSALQTPVRARTASGTYSQAKPAPQPAQPPPQPQQQQQQYQTPRPRIPRNSLHRAVLIRSAQRAAMRVEMEQEEEEEEKEVEQSVAALLGEEVDIIEEIEEEYDEGDEEQQQEGDTTEEEEEPQPVSGWRKSLEVVKSGWERFRSRSRSPEKGEQQPQEDEEQDITEVDPQEDEQDEQEDMSELPESEADEIVQRGRMSMTNFTPQRPQRSQRGSFQPFMTPQAPRPSGSALADRIRGIGRYSFSASMEGRGRGRPSQQPWKVKDIVVPLQVQEEDGEEGQPRKVSTEEKKAIQERRRSAFAAPDPFFGDQIPGTRRTSTAEPLAPGSAATPSPSKSWVASRGIGDVREEEEEDTSVLLERMKEMVEGMKRRRSGIVDPEAVEAMKAAEKEDEIREAEQELGELGYPGSDDLEHLEEEAVEEDDGADVFAEGEDDEDRREESADEQDGQAMDVDEAEEAEVDTSTPIRPSEHTTARLPLKTPHMADLKHVFSTSNASSSTPRYTGVRELFQETAQNQTKTPQLAGVREMYLRARAQDLPPPDYDGLDDMMATPAGYRAKEEAPVQEETDEDASEPSGSGPSGRSTPDEPAPAPARSTRAKKAPPAASKIPAMGTRRRTPAATATATTRSRTTTDGSTMADDEATPDGPAPKAAKKTLGVDKPKGAVVRRTRRMESEDIEETPAVAAKPTARGKKAETTSKLPVNGRAGSSRDAAVPAPTKAVRQTRKAAEPVSTDDEPIAPKPERKTRGGKPASQTQSETDRAPEPRQTKPPARTTSRSKLPEPAATRATSSRQSAKAKEKAKAKAVTPSEDEMDFLERPESPDEAPAAATVRRGRSKAVDTTEEDESSKNTALRASRGRKTPAATAPASTRPTAAKGRTAGAKKEKENTPDSREEEEEKPAAPAKASRVKKPTAAAARAKAQSEPEREPEPAVKTRAARTRAASGRK